MKFKTPDEYKREFIESWIKDGMHYSETSIGKKLITPEIRYELECLGYRFEEHEFNKDYWLIRWN